MKQMTFSDVEYSGRKKVTQKEKFLSKMEQIIPWAEWIGKIQPYYPKNRYLPSVANQVKYCYNVQTAI